MKVYKPAVFCEHCKTMVEFDMEVPEKRYFPQEKEFVKTCPDCGFEIKVKGKDMGFILQDDG